MHDLGTLGGPESYAHAINGRGQVVGQADTAAGDSHAFLYSNGAMHDLGTLGGLYSYATAINNRGQVVGSSATAAGDSHPFLYSDGAMHDLGTLGGPYSLAAAINDRGQVVGYSATATGNSHPFLYSDGTMTDLNSLIAPGSGFMLAAATGISDTGFISGTGITSNSPGHAVLLTPVPEPASLVPLGTGLVCVAGLAMQGRAAGPRRLE